MKDLIKELTDIEVIVFEEEDGSETEMLIVDEFDLNGEHYVALTQADEPDDNDDSISYFRVYREEDREGYELVEDAKLLGALADVLEDRLLSK